MAFNHSLNLRKTLVLPPPKRIFFASYAINNKKPRPASWRIGVLSAHNNMCYTKYPFIRNCDFPSFSSLSARNSDRTYFSHRLLVSNKILFCTLCIFTKSISNKKPRLEGLGFNIFSNDKSTFTRPISIIAYQ